MTSRSGSVVDQNDPTCFLRDKPLRALPAPRNVLIGSHTIMSLHIQLYHMPKLDFAHALATALALVFELALANPLALALVFALDLALTLPLDIALPIAFAFLLALASYVMPFDAVSIISLHQRTSISPHLTSPHLASPRLTLPYLTLPYLTLPYPTLPFPTLPYPTLPYPSLPYLTLPYLTLPYLTLPYLTLPYRTLPYLTVPYRTLPYLTVPPCSEECPCGLRRDTVTLTVGLPSTDDIQGVIRGTCERNEPRGLRHRDRVLGNVPH